MSAGPPDRGRPRRRRPAPGADHGPRRLGDALDDAVAGLRPPSTAPPRADRPPATPASALGRLFSQWEEAVGSRLARHVKPLTLAGDELSVVVDQPAWATQVRMLAPTILERVADVAGVKPERLRVTVRPREESR